MDVITHPTLSDVAAAGQPASQGTSSDETEEMETQSSMSSVTSQQDAAAAGQPTSPGPPQTQPTKQQKHTHILTDK